MTAGRRLLILVALLILGSIAYWWWRSQHPAQPARMVLVPVRYSDVPDWQTTDPRGALAAFRRSCASLARLPDKHPMGGAGYAGRVADWRYVCGQIPGSAVDAGAARAFFQSNFTPISVSAGSDPVGLFTGYYEPELRASRTRHGPFQTPIYGVPKDLVSADLGAFKPELVGEHIEGRVVKGKLVPYATRAQIDRDGLAGAPVLLYAADPVAVFFLHIQGSGRARLDDGSVERIAYASQNGRPYTPIGRVLIANGEIDRAQMSMQAIRAWLKAHPGKADALMEQDQSFVFFREEPVGDASLGAKGSEGVPLTPGASLAVDPRLHALGVPVYVATESDDAPALHRLLVAQDTGGAIRGAVRGDVFWGVGPRAENAAGRMTASGRMFALLPKKLAAKLGDGATFGLKP